MLQVRRDRPRMLAGNRTELGKNAVVNAKKMIRCSAFVFFKLSFDLKRSN